MKKQEFYFLNKKNSITESCDVLKETVNFSLAKSMAIDNVVQSLFMYFFIYFLNIKNKFKLNKAKFHSFGLEGRKCK